MSDDAPEPESEETPSPPPEADPEAVTAVETRAEAAPQARPLYRDPLYLGGVAIALVAAAVYFLFFSNAPPPEPERPQVASFARVAGAVTFRAPNEASWDPAEAGGRLRNRDRVRTEAAGAAELEFDNGNRVQVRPSSEVIVTDPTTALPGGGSAWTVEAGEASFDLQERAQITTPGATTTADALTVGNIEVDATGATGISVFEGQAEVATTGGQRIALSANQGVRVDSAGQAGPRQNLPEPPVQTAPPREALIRWREDGGGATTLVWTPVEHGATYQVAVDLNVEQAELLLSAAFDREGIPEEQLAMDALERGEYYWRVAGVNSDGMAGAYSGVWFFSVTEATEPPPAPLSIAGVTGLGEIIHVSGTTAPGSEVTVDGHVVRVGPDGRFSEYLRRPATGAILIRAVQPDGSETEERRSIVDAPAGGD